MAQAVDDEDGGRTVSCRLNQLVHSNDSLTVIEEAVQRVHRTAIHASEAIALLSHEDIEAGTPLDAMLPLGAHGTVDAMFRAVVSGRRGSTADSPQKAAQDRVLGAFHRIHGAEATLVDGTGLGQLLKYESQFWIATLKTGICAHFRARVHRYCKLRLRLPDAAYDALSREGRKVHTRHVLCVTTDVCRPGWQQRVADAGDAVFVDATRSMLRLDGMAWAPTNSQNRPTKKTLTDLVKAHPQHFLPGLAALNRAFAEAGERTFRLVPMRTNLMPKFVNVDQQVVKELGLVGDDKRKVLNRDAKKRCEAQKPFNEALKALKARHRTEKAGWKQDDLGRNAELGKGQRKQKPSAQESARRKAREEAMAAELAALNRNPELLRLRARAGTEKRGAMDDVFDASKVLSKKNAAMWGRSLKTDGVSARLLLVHEEDGGAMDASTNKRDRAGRRPLPRRGLLSVDELRDRVLGDAAATKLSASTLSALKIYSLNKSSLKREYVIDDDTRHTLSANAARGILTLKEIESETPSNEYVKTIYNIVNQSRWKLCYYDNAFHFVKMLFCATYSAAIEAGRTVFCQGLECCFRCTYKKTSYYTRSNVRTELGTDKSVPDTFIWIPDPTYRVKHVFFAMKYDDLKTCRPSEIYVSKSVSLDTPIANDDKWTLVGPDIIRAIENSQCDLSHESTLKKTKVFTSSRVRSV